MATINGRLGLTGTVVIEGTALRWNITSPTPANFTYGSSTMIPLVGDWNGDGIEGIGAYEPIAFPRFHLRQTATGGAADVICPYGISGDVPISWYDSSSKDGIGVIRGTKVYLDKNLSCGDAEINTTTDTTKCYSPIIKQCTYTPPTSNTLIYVAIAAAGLAVIYMATRKK